MRRGSVSPGWEGGGGRKEGTRIGSEVLSLLDFLDVEVDGASGMGESVGGAAALFEERFAAAAAAAAAAASF